MLEVEQKYTLPNEVGFASRLAALGAVLGPTVEQTDTYYNHPSRDFAATDEALRLRSVDGEDRVTYKGPKQGGVAKTREEIELPLAAGTVGGWADVLLRLGFRRVAAVRKQRTIYRLAADRRYELSIDRVEGLGLFAEVETLADEADRDEAADAVAALAEKLGLMGAEPRSYLELVLARSA